MITTDLLKKVQKLAFRARYISEHLLAGQYHSHFRGKGMTFSELRKYQFGDDVRSIDWNVTARYQEPYLKVFQEERALNLLLLVDVSASMNFGTSSQSKRELAQELAAVLALAAHQNNDQVGLVLFSDQVEHLVRPQKGYQHILRLIRDMLEHKPVEKKTNIAVALQLAMSLVKQKSIVCIISDFASSDYQSLLQLASARHEVIGLHVSDVRETELPNVGWLPVQEAETGAKAWLPTFLKGTRNQYNNLGLQHIRDTQAIFKSSKADLLQIHTGEDYVDKLRTFFVTR
ncbi:DUF58 domain-containing protein [Xanthocytophaga agilis]|uniref:DUF58 domain-containing protein n=1 Tax=Xanthocytophaga agilis TaxID=3048010 RepID=A0AAE3R2I6_9BACT|nr:DUF58 domain-containing protein [Xanthocytophaga agilis]MDJ1499688.1 DUF58 domain-containing protein [Xanthocytophaga agilis]